MTDDQTPQAIACPTAPEVGTVGQPAPPPAMPPLDRMERRQLDTVRLFGTVGAVLMAFGALGAGAAPVFNPVAGVPLLGLFSRMGAVSVACAYVGIFMIVLAWLWLGRFARPSRQRLVTLSQVNRTLVMWATPLALVPPMFSRDVYSYLAQSEIAARGKDPYVLGPATALGVDHPLTRGVPNIWRDTPAPYGPLFLDLGRGAAWLAGDNVVLGVLLHRVLALGGVALIVWALPRLARRFGVQPVNALWLGAANPLVLFHLVSGVHNEALMVGLMLAGLEIALKAMPVVPAGGPAPPTQPRELLGVVLGAVVITLGASVKVPAALALGFLGVALARRWGGRLWHLLRAAALLLAVFAVVMVTVAVGTGLGFGWIGALGVANTIKSWMAPATALGMFGGGIGILLGLGNHSESVLGLTRFIGQATGALISVRLLWDGLRGRFSAMGGLGLGLGAVVLLGPVVHPWYLLWAAIPLAAANTPPKFRTAATVISAVVALLWPPTGATFDGRAYVLLEAVIAALVTVGLLLFALRHRLPLRETAPNSLSTLPDRHRTGTT